MRPEVHHAREECPEVGKWSAPDVMASEVETSQFLASLVSFLKPYFVVETGTYLGHTAQAIGDVLDQQGSGLLVTIEQDPDRAEQARHRVASLPVTVITGDACSWAPFEGGPYGLIDLLFCDTELSLRPAEIRHFAQWASPRCVIAVHDTQDAGLRDALNALAIEGVTGPWTFLPTPRGVGLSRYRNPGRAVATLSIPLSASPGTVAYLGRWNLPFFFAGQIVGLDVPRGSAKVAIEGADVAQSRNKAVERMLEFADHRWLLFIDDDMLFGDDALSRLLAHDVPVVSALTLARRRPHTPCVYPITEAQMVSGELIEVEEAGTGFLLIRRDVLEAIPKPWFEGGRIDAGELREDKAFCQKVKAAGFSIYCDTALRIGHQMDAWVQVGPNGKPQIATL